MRRKGSQSGADTFEPAGGEVDLSGLARAIWRRKRWVILPTVIAGAAAAVFVFMATPQFRSQAQVLIENRETAYNRPETLDRSGAERAAPDAEAIQSEVQLALSRDLARAVVRELRLAEKPEFNPASGISPLGAIMSLIGGTREDSGMSLEERVLERFYERLSVYPVERSRVIVIEFRSESAVLAADVANKVAERLLEFQRAAKQERMRQAGHWLAGEIEVLRTRVGEAEARVEDFRSKNNLYIGSNNVPLSAQQLGEMNTQLGQVRTQRADAETKAQMIREMLKGGRPIEASDIVNSELIRRLNEQRITLQAQLAEQSSTLLGQHPRIKELKAQISDLEAQSRTEAAKLARTLENDAKMAAAREQSLNANLDQLKKHASALGAEDVQLRAIDREAKSQRDLLEAYLARYRDVTAREGPDAVPADARVLSQAVPASAPYFPKKLPIIIMTMLAVAISATTLIAFAELMSSSYSGRVRRPIDESLPAELPAQAPPSWIDGARRTSPAAKAESETRARQRHLAALADHVENLGRGIVAVTRADGDSPAVDVALELARELGQRGGRVLLLNFEVGANAISRLSPDPRAPGFADLIFGVAHFGEVIQRDRSSRVHLIPVGRGIRDTATLLGGERLAIILGALSQTYDHVIAAAPGLNGIERAERLARFTRGTLVIAAEGAEDAGTAASDALAMRGFANVAVVTVSADAVPPDNSAARAAA